MTSPRLTGTHHHAFDNIPDVQPGEDNEPGDVFTLDADLHPVWEPPAAAEHDIISETHTDTDPADTPADGDVLTFATADSKWHPAAPTSGGGGVGRFYIPFGSGEEVFTA